MNKKRILSVLKNEQGVSWNSLHTLRFTEFLGWTTFGCIYYTAMAMAMNNVFRSELLYDF